YLHRANEAEAIYRAALALGPHNARTLNNLAALLQRTGRPLDAEAAYRQAIAADPGYAEARWNLGFLLLARGRLEEG
ncbi:tetratricopeptide repeat protein, partial [Acinetobacter baumannii]|nr:tetratricopeptide repeat protein [Acinetobacter baumannii]